MSFSKWRRQQKRASCISLSLSPAPSPCGKRRQLARQHALLALSRHLTLPRAANQRRATCQAAQWHMRSAELLLVQVMSINGSKNNSSSLFRARSDGDGGGTATFCTSCSQLKCEVGERKTRASVEISQRNRRQNSIELYTTTPFTSDSP